MPLPKISVQARITVSEVVGETKKNFKVNVVVIFRSRFYQIKLCKCFLIQPLAQLTKRSHPVSAREASCPCLVPRKSLKLIIRTNSMSNRSIESTSQPSSPGRYVKKTSTSTVTRTDLVPGSSPLSELYTGDKDIDKESGKENGKLTCMRLIDFRQQNERK